ncbi:MAG TPA: hypothetical protein VGH67_21975 [Solirubrobacteraceae bacterium]|jgi:hypothetical protein
MNRKLMNRRTAGALTAALALGSAGPALARPFDLTAQGSYVPAGSVSHKVQAEAYPPDMPPLHAAYYGEVLPPFVPAHMKGFPETTAAPVATATPRAVVNQPAAGGSDLIYVLAGGVVFAIGGLGGAALAGHRRKVGAGSSGRPRIAA